MRVQQARDAILQEDRFVGEADEMIVDVPEPVAQRVAVPLGDDAGEGDGVAVDRARDVARQEITLMRALQRVFLLLEVQRVGGLAGGVLDVDA